MNIETVVTVAGGNGVGAGLMQLDQPVDVYFLRNVRVYVSDSANHRIVMWETSEGHVVAGMGLEQVCISSAVQEDCK